MTTAGASSTTAPLGLEYGARIKLQHVATAHRLHSHGSKYPTGSKQQQVTCFGGEDANDWWIVKPQHGKALAPLRGEAVADGAVIRLEHEATRRNLHSHNIEGHVAKQRQLEVTAYGANGEGDANDDWIVRLAQDGDGSIRLQHVSTSKLKDHNGFLHSHGLRYPSWGHGQQEVTNFHGKDRNDLWRVRPDPALMAVRLVPSSHGPLTFAAGDDRSITAQLGRIRAALPASLTAPTPEFAPAVSLVCVRPEWLVHTRLQRYTRMIAHTLSTNTELAASVRAPPPNIRAAVLQGYTYTNTPAAPCILSLSCRLSCCGRARHACSLLTSAT